MPRTHRRIAVWFDSGCPLCTREVAIMRRLDWFNRVDFIDIYTAESVLWTRCCFCNDFTPKKPTAA
ncbi:MAG: DCC1-like thiol-disulfide oxidoreductase family protein [Candidatus Azotimanducaceae bacterium]